MARIRKKQKIKKGWRWLLYAAVCLGLFLLCIPLAGRYRRTPAAAAGEVQEAMLDKVIDGDTLLTEGGDKLRLLGIDAPESVHHDASRNTEYGRLASAHLKELVGNRTRLWIMEPEGVEIRDRDNYDRLLRLVWTEPPLSFGEQAAVSSFSGQIKEDVLRRSLNGQMLADGYATVFVMEELPFEDLFYEIQREAMEQKKGLWAREDWRSYAALQQLTK